MGVSPIGTRLRLSPDGVSRHPVKRGDSIFIIHVRVRLCVSRRHRSFTVVTCEVVSSPSPTWMSRPLNQCSQFEQALITPGNPGSLGPDPLAQG